MGASALPLSNKKVWAPEIKDRDIRVIISTPQLSRLYASVDNANLTRWFGHRAEPSRGNSPAPW
jgi:hypothetical protein